MESGLYNMYILVYYLGMTTTTATALAQPWWCHHNSTYLIVYYARTIARIARAYRSAKEE